MDYLHREDSVHRYTPGPYDVAAVRYSHGLEPDQLHHFPFCTDDAVTRDPECVQFDWSGYHPLDAGVNDWRLILDYLLDHGVEGREIYVDYYSRLLRAFVVADHSPLFYGSWAYDELYSPLRTQFQLGDYRAIHADDIARRLFHLMWNEPSSYDRIHGPPGHAWNLELMTYDLGAIARNEGGFHGFDTRRLAVDLLEDMQTLEAYTLLLEARDRIAEELASGALDSPQQALALDLQARIDQACSPYFD